MIASSTPYSWSFLKASLAYGPTTGRILFTKHRCQVYPILTCWSPGCLSSLISFPNISEWYAVHHGWFFIGHSVRNSINFVRSALYYQKNRIQCYNMAMSSPLCHAPPEIHHPTSRIVSFVMSNGKSSGGGPRYMYTWLLVNIKKWVKNPTYGANFSVNV